MKIKFLGVGGMFCTENGNSNLLLTHGNKNLLIDCGYGIPYLLKEHNIDIKDIDAVYISHVHSDHAGGLDYLGYASYFSGHKIKLIAQEMVINQLSQMLLPSMGLLRDGKYMSLSDYFYIHSIKNKEEYFWHWPSDGIGMGSRDMAFYLIPNDHIMTTFGLVASHMNNSFYFSSDCYINDMYVPKTTDEIYMYKEFKSDIIFHDCEVSDTPSGVHSHYDTLKKLPLAVKQKMWLYHYSANLILPNAKQDGFAGFVKKGQEFNFGVH